MSSNVNYSEILEFNDFIEEIKLIDLPKMGNKFIWFNISYREISR